MAIVEKHLEEVHEAEALVAEVEASREELRRGAREQMGVTMSNDAPPSLRQALRDNHVGLYPLTALGLLAIVDRFQPYAFAVLAPDISRALGVGKGVIAGLVALKTLAVGLSPLPIAALAQRRARRALLCIVTGLLWSIFAFSTGFVVLVSGLVFVLVADGVSTGSIYALHRPLLFDLYPAETRVRVLSAYQGFESAGNILAPLAVAFLSAVMGFTWRGVFMVLGAVSVLGVAFASRLRDPGFGRFDEQRIRQAVHSLHDEPVRGVTELDREVSLGFFEILRRLMLIPTIRRLVVGLAVVGMLVVPYQTFLFFFLEERWGMGPGGRGIFFAFTAGVSVAAVAAFSRKGEARFRQNPGGLLKLSGGFLVTAVVLICLGGVAPWFPLMVTAFGLASAFIGLLTPAIYAPLLSVIPSHTRPHAAALMGIFEGGVGGLLGALFLSGIDRRFGIAGSLVSLLIPGVVGGLLLANSGKYAQQDLDRMIDEVIEDEEVRRITEAGRHLPMLACRHIDFSYGQLQVLFGVDFTVDDGEMVALLGVNGAGKSTLLKVISGIGLPSRGTVRSRGVDITYLDAERRVGLGITQIPGGRAVFGPMTVVENLRGFAYTLGRDGKAVDAALDRCFEAFPRLAERRNQRASTLSGGEQQMLGLSKALILRPRLLLIDELSLGLAPVIVGQLLDMVRKINEQGTAIVLVEQSVNIALNLVDHAYFMEKGEIRFDGAARDLLHRDDLLRAVFLEGAETKG